jgi:hypothetical protein
MWACVDVDQLRETHEQAAICAQQAHGHAVWAGGQLKLRDAEARLA